MEIIVDSVKEMYHEGCAAKLVLADSTSDEAKQELSVLNVLLMDKWMKQELAHFQLSAALSIYMSNKTLRMLQLQTQKCPSQ